MNDKQLSSHAKSFPKDFTVPNSSIMHSFFNEKPTTELTTPPELSIQKLWEKVCALETEVANLKLLIK